MKNVLKTLIVIEGCIISVLFLLFSMDVIIMNHMFIIVIAIAAIEAGIGFRLLINLIRIHNSSLNYIIHI